ncbi:MAG: hypothetical protein IJJ15_01585 [Ruminococcus sp.]|nr:hypothetical protein [Ruminococcus sp.]
MTNETDAWNSFFASGSVLDYLQYKAIQKAKHAADFNKGKEKDEIQDEGRHPQTTEYR